MPKTRSTKSSTKDKSDDVGSSQTVKSLPESEANPSKVFVLPKNTSKDARIITLLDPASNQPNRYFICPNKGLHEFLRISAPKADPRSWLLTTSNHVEDCNRQQAYLSQSQDLFVATPVDCAFFLLTLLFPHHAFKDSKKAMFLTFDDHIDTATNLPSQFKNVLQNPLFRPMFEKRLSAICDIVDAGEESMFRISTTKLANLVFSKARRVVDRGLPPSMEQKFISQALQPPMTAKSRLEVTQAQKIETGLTPDEKTDSQTTVVDCEPTTNSITTSFASTIVCTEISSGPQAESGVRDLLRVNTALDFILKSYTPEYAREIVRNELTTSKVVDFAPLTDHLKHLESLRVEARALQQISDNISRKRGMDDDEKEDLRAEKKRKKEEEELRKKNESRAVKQLKKADTSGMKKLSSFFTKAPKKDVSA